MNIWLCHKSYEVKITQGAKRAFSEKFKRDLLGAIQEVMICFLHGNGVSDLETQSKAKKIMTEVEAAFLLYSIIKPANPSIPIEEIEDAVSRLPWRIGEETDERCLPWTTIVHRLGLDYDEIIGGVASGKKLSADILDFLGQS